MERDGEREPGVALTRDDVGNGQTVLTLAVDGYSDDSVRGERWPWILEDAGEDKKIVAKGSQIKCWRGWRAGKWISGNKLCS